MGGELVVVYSLLDVVDRRGYSSEVQTFDDLDEVLMAHESNVCWL